MAEEEEDDEPPSPFPKRRFAATPAAMTTPPMVPYVWCEVKDEEIGKKNAPKMVGRDKAQSTDGRRTQQQQQA